MQAVFQRKRTKGTVQSRQPGQSKPVTDYIVLHSSTGPSLYYLCPSCEILLPREYMDFCDCCGQQLGWEQVAAAEENV